MGLLKPAGKEPISAPGQFVLYKELKEVGKGELMVDGFLVSDIQGGSHSG
jgi:hypothetical protein